jgi:hypothetical protein
MPAAQRVTPVNPVPLVPPAPPTPVNPVAPAAPPTPSPAQHRIEPVPASMGSASRALDAAIPGLSAAMREQVWAIVRAAVDESLAPVQQKLRDVETKLERAASTKAAPIPVATQHVAQPQRLASLPPVDSSIPPAPAGGAAAVIRVPPAAAIPISLAPAATSSIEPAPVTRPSYTSTSYGLVSHPPGPPPKSIADAAAEVALIEIPDFGRKKRIVGRVVVAVMILAVVGAAVATILSHQG